MNDSISRQAAIDAIEEYADRLQMVNWKENPNVPYKVYSLNWCINTIRDLPSAQPEIVRCEDCNKSREWPNGRWCSLFRASVNTDSYCSFGAKRKEGREE